MGRFQLLRRFQSTSLAQATRGSVSLDLDFVLNLLDPSKTTNSNATTTATAAVTPKWSQMKFKVIEADEGESSSVPKETEQQQPELYSFSQSFINAFDSNVSTSADILTRLQSLADSLPTQFYDRHGNLIPLNTSQPPSSFFELENIKTTTTSTQQAKFVPIFHRENVDWSQVSITSILKKIVPEEAFINATEESADMTDSVTDTSELIPNNIPTVKQQPVNVGFTQTELRLLDKDQLHALAKHFRVSCDQTDLKIEADLLLNHFNIQVRRQVSKRGEKIDEKICWTEANENLLVKLYENLRIEKQKTDQKLITLISSGSHNNSSSVQSLKRGNGASERGLWAVLADQMRLASKSRSSVSECRNKLIILKRLKQ